MSACGSISGGSGAGCYSGADGVSGDASVISVISINVISADSSIVRLPAERMQQHRLAERMVLRTFQSGEHLLLPGDDNRARIVAEGVRDSFLPSVFDTDEIRKPPHHGDIPVSFKLPGGIAAVQSIGKRIRLGLQGDDFPVELPLPGKRLIKRLLTGLEGCSGCVECRSPVVIGVLALLFQLSDARARLLRLCPHIGQLCGQVGDSGVRRMHRRFLASDQLPQIGDMRVALFRGFAQFGQGLANRGETPFMVSACFGRLIIGEPRVIDCTPLLGYLPLKFVSAFGEHVGVFAGIGHNLRADGSGTFCGHRSKRAESFLKP